MAVFVVLDGLAAGLPAGDPSQIGVSIIKKLYREAEERNKSGMFNGDEVDLLDAKLAILPDPMLMSSTCLAHDIGHSSFGNGDQIPAKLRERSLRSLYWCSDGVDGRRAAVTNLSCVRPSIPSTGSHHQTIGSNSWSANLPGSFRHAANGGVSCHCSCQKL